MRIWGKKDRFHPLLFHMMDVATVSAEILKSDLFIHLKEFLFKHMVIPDSDGNSDNRAESPGGYELEESGEISDLISGRFINILSYLFALHDLGKADEKFQRRDEDTREDLERIGELVGYKLTFYNDQSSRYYSHGAMSGLYIRKVLEKDISVLLGQLTHSEDIYKDSLKFLLEIMNLIFKSHHGSWTAKTEKWRSLKEDDSFLEWDPIKKGVARVLRDALIEVPEYDHLENGSFKLHIEKMDLDILTTQMGGLLVFSDWVASNTNFFSPVSIEEALSYISTEFDGKKTEREILISYLAGLSRDNLINILRIYKRKSRRNARIAINRLGLSRPVRGLINFDFVTFFRILYKDITKVFPIQKMGTDLIEAVQSGAVIDPQRVKDVSSAENDCRVALTEDSGTSNPGQSPINNNSNDLTNHSGLLPILLPKLFIMEAPMGSGKTEIALYLSHFLISSLNLQGAYFALPTMATSNQMYSRFAAFLRAWEAVLHKGNEALTRSIWNKDDWDDMDLEETINLQLVHGRSWLVDDIEMLTEIQLRNRYDDFQTDPDLFILRWFSPNRRALLAPFGAGTIDQALMSMFPVKFGVLRNLGLGHKVIILDEVHAYDFYTGNILNRLIQWQAAYGSPMILLSATLPGAKKREIIGKFIKALNNCSKDDKNDGIKGMDGLPIVFWNEDLGVFMEINIGENVPYPMMTLLWDKKVKLKVAAMANNAGGSVSFGEIYTHGIQLIIPDDIPAHGTKTPRMGAYNKEGTYNRKKMISVIRKVKRIRIVWEYIIEEWEIIARKIWENVNRPLNESETLCIAVILNTVAGAQKVFRRLKKLYDDHYPNPNNSTDKSAADSDEPDGRVQLFLYHSRFTAKDRQEIERRVVGLFGKRSIENSGSNGGWKRPKRAVVVATQVIEQSLDLDFDEMYSEIAPIDLLLQRMGRMHRHDRSSTRGKIGHFHIIAPSPDKIYGGSNASDIGSDKPVFKKTGTGIIYHPSIILYLTYHYLHKIPDGLLEIPSDIRPLIEKVYSFLNGIESNEQIENFIMGFSEDSDEMEYNMLISKLKDAGLEGACIDSFSGKFWLKEIRDWIENKRESKLESQKFLFTEPCTKRSFFKYFELDLGHTLIDSLDLPGDKNSLKYTRYFVGKTRLEKYPTAEFLLLDRVRDNQLVDEMTDYLKKADKKLYKRLINYDGESGDLDGQRLDDMKDGNEIDINNDIDNRYNYRNNEYGPENKNEDETGDFKNKGVNNEGTGEYVGMSDDENDGSDKGSDKYSHYQNTRELKKKIMQCIIRVPFYYISGCKISDNLRKEGFDYLRTKRFRGYPILIFNNGKWKAEVSDGNEDGRDNNGKIRILRYDPELGLIKPENADTDEI